MPAAAATPAKSAEAIASPSTSTGSSGGARSKSSRASLPCASRPAAWETNAPYAAAAKSGRGLPAACAGAGCPTRGSAAWPRSINRRVSARAPAPAGVNSSPSAGPQTDTTSARCANRAPPRASRCHRSHAAWTASVASKPPAARISALRTRQVWRGKGGRCAATTKRSSPRGARCRAHALRPGVAANQSPCTASVAREARATAARRSSPAGVGQSPASTNRIQSARAAARPALRAAAPPSATASTTRTRGWAGRKAAAGPTTRASQSSHVCAASAHSVASSLRPAPAADDDRETRMLRHGGRKLTPRDRSAWRFRPGGRPYRLATAPPSPCGPPASTCHGRSAASRVSRRDARST